MKVDSPTILGIFTVSILCVLATSMVILETENFHANDQDLTDSVSMEKEYQKQAEKMLYEINQQGMVFQKNGHEKQFEEQMVLMQQKQKEVVSHYLELNINEVYIKENYNFPYKDAAGIKSLDFRSQKPVCDIPANIPTHLKKIQNSDLFQIFSGKYSPYHITFEMSDERLGGSWVHYTIFATSEDETFTASIFFHIDSCTNELVEGYNLNCHDAIQFDSIHTRDKKEVISSLQSSEFCTIHFEPWKQALYDYYKEILHNEKKHADSLEATSNSKKNQDLGDWEKEMERLGQLGNIVGYAMNRDTRDEQFQSMVKKYTDGFGDLPDELLKMIDAAKQQIQK